MAAGSLSMEIPTGFFDNSSSGNVVNFQTLDYAVNPFVYGTDADDMTSSILQFSVTDADGNDNVTSADAKFVIGFPNTGATTSSVTQQISENATNPLLYHKLNVTSSSSALMVKLVLDGDADSFDVYISKDVMPTKTQSDIQMTSPATSSGGTSEVNVMVPSTTLSGIGIYYLGLEPVTNTTGSSSRRRRSVSNSTTSSYGTVQVSYSVTMATSSCRTYDSATNSWTTSGCEVDASSTVSQTSCRCTPSTTRKAFGVSFLAAPNTIDFSTVWAKFADLGNNAAVFGTVIGLLGVYVLLAVWARYMDKADMAWTEMKELADNTSGDNYVYVVTVETGYKIGAGTTANVYFVLSGSLGDTGVRCLSADTKSEFPRGKTQVFYLASSCGLGRLTTLRVWHDGVHGGSANAWYLSKVSIEDVDDKRKYTFLCNNWLSLENDDGKIDRTLFSARKCEVSQFSYLFAENSKEKMAEHHMLFSVFFRPSRNNFTRVQRLSCVLSFMFLSMIVSCMFYRTEENVERPQSISIGPFSFSMQELFVSVITIAIVVPVNLIIIELFRRTNDLNMFGAMDKIKANREADSMEKMPINEKLSDNHGMNTKLEQWDFGKKLKAAATENLELDSMKIIDIDDMEGSFDGEEAKKKNNEDKEKKKKMLPSWMRYIAWLLLACAVLPSAFFVILYSLEWGKEKAEQWLTSFVLSTLESILLVDPLKAIGLAVIVSFLISKSSKKDEDDDEENPELPPPDMSDEEIMEMRRQQAVKRSAAHTMMRDTIMLVIFAWTVFSLTYVVKDTWDHKVHTSINDMFLDGSTGFLSSVSNEASYYKWLSTVFVPNYFVENDVNGNRLHWRDRKYVVDRAGFRVGPARLRQLRSRYFDCHKVGKISLANYHSCVHGYSESIPETSSFGLGLTPEGLTEIRYTPDAWDYTSAAVTEGLPHTGEFATYGGEGFLLELDINQNVSEAMINELVANSWLDRQTRAVFVEFTVYHPNVNIFAFTKLLAEKSQYGGMVTSSHTDVFRVYAVGLSGIYTYVCLGVFAFFFIYHLVVLIVFLVKTKCSMDNWATIFLDVGVLLLQIYLGVFYGLRYAGTESVMAKYRVNNLRFTQFSLVALYDARYKDGWGFLTAIVTLKLCTLLRLNKRFSRLGYTIRHMAVPLLNFVIQAGAIFLAFIMVAYLFYMGHIFEFGTFSRASLTMFSFAMGSFGEMDQMEEVEETFARIFFLCFMVFVNIVQVNIMVTVIMDSHDTFKDAETLSTKDYELIDVIRNDVSDFTKKMVKMAQK